MCPAHHVYTQKTLSSWVKRKVETKIKIMRQWNWPLRALKRCTNFLVWMQSITQSHCRRLVLVHTHTMTEYIWFCIREKWKMELDMYRENILMNVYAPPGCLFSRHYSGPGVLISDNFFTKEECARLSQSCVPHLASTNPKNRPPKRGYVVFLWTLCIALIFFLSLSLTYIYIYSILNKYMLALHINLYRCLKAVVLDVS